MNNVSSWLDIVVNLKELSSKEMVNHPTMIKINKELNESCFDDEKNKPLLEAFNNWLIKRKDPKGVDVFLEIFYCFEKPNQPVSTSVGEDLIRFLTGHHSYHVDSFYLQNDFNNVYYKIYEKFGNKIAIHYLTSPQKHNNCEFFFKKFLEIYKKDLSDVPISSSLIQWVYFEKLIKYMDEFNQLTDYHIKSLLSEPFLPKDNDLNEVMTSEKMIQRCGYSFLKKESELMSVIVPNSLIDHHGYELAYGIKCFSNSSKYVELRFFRIDDKIHIALLKIWSDAGLKDISVLKKMDLDMFEKSFNQIAIEFNEQCNGNPRLFDHDEFVKFLNNLAKAHILVTTL